MKEKVKKLKVFISKNHFIKENWEDRGLIISESEVVNYMGITIQQFAMRILAKFEYETKTEDIEKDLISEIDNLEISRLDTEEKEWFIDLICEIGEIVGIKSKMFDNSLNVLMYGQELADLLSKKEEKESKFVQSFKVENNCSVCGSTLKCSVKEEGVENGEIGIAKCGACKEHSLFFVPEGTRFLTSYNFHPVEIVKRSSANAARLKAEIEKLKEQNT